jgi:hypothetical protein
VTGFSWRRKRGKKHFQSFAEEQRILRLIDSRPDLYELLRSSRPLSRRRWIWAAVVAGVVAVALIWLLG